MQPEEPSRIQGPYITKCQQLVALRQCMPNSDGERLFQGLAAMPHVEQIE